MEFKSNQQDYRDFIQELKEADRDTLFLVHNVRDAFKAAGAKVVLNANHLDVKYDGYEGTVWIRGANQITCEKPAGLGMFNIMNAILRRDGP